MIHYEMVAGLELTTGTPGVFLAMDGLFSVLRTP